MDNLINKWKQTVENHNKKLKNLREESLTRSLSKERTAAITASSLLLQSKNLPASQNTSGIMLNNKRNRNTNIHSTSSSSDSAAETNQQPKTSQHNHTESLEIDNNPSTIIDNSLDITNATVSYTCDDPATRQLTETILSLFPQKKQHGQILADTLLRANAKHIKEHSRLQRQIGQKEKEMASQRQESDMTRNRLQDLQQRIAGTQQQVRQLQNQNAELSHLEAQQVAKLNQQRSQNEIISLLKQSQESLEQANQRLEKALVENRRAFREKEEVWESELAEVRKELSLLRNKS